VISYQLPVTSDVKLAVYDVLGREVAMVVSEELPAGNYTRQWNAASVSSGVYFYRLEAHPLGGQPGAYTETRKLVVLR
jgi:hypothetical protein